MGLSGVNVLGTAFKRGALIPPTSVGSWVGICSLLTAPVFAGLAFVLVWGLRQDVAKLAFGKFALESILITTLIMLAMFLAMTFWQTGWAVRLIRDAMAADPRRGYFLLAMLLFAVALVALLTASIINVPRFPYSAAEVMLAWLPAGLAALGSAVAMSRARANAFLWLGYLLFVPLFAVSIHTLTQSNICHQLSVAGSNVAFLSQLQAPWIMVGFAMVVATMLVVVVKTWRAGVLDGWLGLRAATIGIPLTAFALVTLGTWAAFSGLAGCVDGQKFATLTHVVGSFYW
jgi:hypothetical protein